MATVAFNNVAKSFGDTAVLSGLDLEVADGEFLVLLGPSGCGKTTALRMVAGLETPTSGTISIGGNVVNDVAPQDRDVAMVFQNYALYPHLTVAKNIGFPLRHRGVDATLRAAKVQRVAEQLGLAELLDRKPRQLSGGQRQRVALARAIVREPVCFLMDEPLSNLDATLRARTRSEIVRLQRELGTTTIFVTHDQVEAMTMGDRIAVLNAGDLQQVGTPSELFENPANAFVASFIGNPGMSLLQADSRDGRLTIGGVETEFIAESGASVTVGVRIDGAKLSSSGIPAICEGLEVLGAEVHVLTRIGDDQLIVRQHAADARPTTGAQVFVTLTTQPLCFDSATGLRVRS
jgi:multiple sugar transport system ATP-binding protein